MAAGRNIVVVVLLASRKVWLWQTRTKLGPELSAALLAVCGEVATCSIPASHVCQSTEGNWIPSFFSNVRFDLDNNEGNRLKEASSSLLFVAAKKRWQHYNRQKIAKNRLKQPSSRFETRCKVACSTGHSVNYVGFRQHCLGWVPRGDDELTDKISKGLVGAVGEMQAKFQGNRYFWMRWRWRKSETCQISSSSFFGMQMWYFVRKWNWEWLLE